MNLDHLTREYVLSEVEQVQYLFRMKDVIRYGQNRDSEVIKTESVAEHLYGLIVLANYFLPLQNPEGTWDRLKIIDLVMCHDVDEIENGDVISYKKTDADRARAKIDAETTFVKSPQNMAINIRSVHREYELQESVEARFAKALDKIEPAFQVYNVPGKKLLQHMKTTCNDHMSIKAPFLVEFPILERYDQVLMDAMQKQDFFVPEIT